MISNLAQSALTMSQWPDVSLVLKATALMALGLLAARVATSASASFRHLLLAATFIALLVLPFAATLVPEMAVRVPLTVAAPAPSASVALPMEAAARTSPSPAADSMDWPVTWQTLLRVGWAAGCALLLASLAVTMRRLGRLRRAGLPWPDLRDAVRHLAVDAGVARHVDVMLHEAVASPITFGIRHPVIALPLAARTWSDADLRRALVHELEHVRRGDWALQITARAVCAVWWFQPLVWVLWRQLSLDAERACDDAVIAKEQDMEYAEQLVNLAARLSAAGTQFTLGMANRSDLSARVSALLDAGRRRGRVGAGALSGVLSVAVLLGVAIAPLRALPATAEATPLSPAAAGQQERVQRALDRELYEAARAGDTVGVNSLVDAGASVDAAIAGDGSPLIAAARAGHTEVARVLLDKGADPNLAVHGDGSPLIAAAGHGRTETAALLLQRGAQVDLAVPDDENALIQASAAGKLDVVKLLVESGADVNARLRADVRRDSRAAIEWRTPLGMARQGGHTAVAAFLVAAGALE